MVKKLATRAKKSSNKKSLFMSKSEFNKLSLSNQRIVIAKDVIKQIKIKKVIPNQTTFIDRAHISISPSADIKKFMGLPPKYKCEACAKGAMFLSFCGIKNNFTIYDNLGMEFHTDSMQALSKIFSKEQLSMIENAFETSSMSWNTDYLSYEKSNTAIAFGNKYKTDKGRLLAICNNIIKNKGEFKP